MNGYDIEYVIGDEGNYDEVAAEKAIAALMYFAKEAPKIIKSTLLRRFRV